MRIDAAGLFQEAIVEIVALMSRVDTHALNESDSIATCPALTLAYFSSRA